MSEKIEKKLRRATEGTRITRRGMRALRRAYYATPWNERKNFNPHDLVAQLKKTDLARQAAIYESVHAKVNAYNAAAPLRKARRRRQFWMAPLALAAAWWKQIKR